MKILVVEVKEEYMVMYNYNCIYLFNKIELLVG